MPVASRLESKLEPSLGPWALALGVLGAVVVSGVVASGVYLMAWTLRKRTA